MDPRLEPLLERTPAWMQPGGSEDDVVLASRVRFARNLAGRRFPQQMPVEEARDVTRLGRERAAGFFEDGTILEPAGLTAAERDLLIERSLASRDLLEAPRPTLLLFDRDETLGLLVNEEDHFRMQGLVAGLDLGRALDRVKPLAKHLEKVFDLARHPRFGYLTACPTNVGTGMRASLLLHLPALARAKSPLQRALQAAQKSFLAVRGVHGEGSGAMGHLYQISNQRTLGEEVLAQMEAVRDFGTKVAKYERDVRAALLKEDGNRRVLDEDVRKAWQALADSKEMTTGQALEALSTLRLAALGGVASDLGLDCNSAELLNLTFQVQRGHLQARIGSELDASQRDSSRARLLREALGIAHSG